VQSLLGIPLKTISSQTAHPIELMAIMGVDHSAINKGLAFSFLQ